jgi:hypothetical protein
LMIFTVSLSLCLHGDASGFVLAIQRSHRCFVKESGIGNQESGLG